MAEELVQVVDTNDNPLRGAAKGEIQERGWFYRVARVMVEDGQGRLLIQKRNNNASLFPGRWDNSAAGHVAEGEPYDITAVREVGEEVGIQAGPLNEIGYYQSSHIDNGGLELNEWQKVYKIIVPQNTTLKLQESKVSATKWIPIQEAKKLAQTHPNQVTPGLADVLERYY